MIGPWDVCTVALREPSAEQGNRALAKPIKGSKNITARVMMQPAKRDRSRKPELDVFSSKPVQMLRLCWRSHVTADLQLLERLRANCRVLHCTSLPHREGQQNARFGMFLTQPTSPSNFPCTEAPLPACMFRNPVRKAKKQFLRCEAVGRSGGVGAAWVGIPGRLTGGKDAN